MTKMSDYYRTLHVLKKAENKMDIMLIQCNPFTKPQMDAIFDFTSKMDVKIYKYTPNIQLEYVDDEPLYKIHILSTLKSKL
jgi:hypothetical protein